MRGDWEEGVSEGGREREQSERSLWGRVSKVGKGGCAERLHGMVGEGDKLKSEDEGANRMEERQVSGEVNGGVREIRGVCIFVN